MRKLVIILFGIIALTIEAWFLYLAPEPTFALRVVGNTNTFAGKPAVILQLTNGTDHGYFVYYIHADRRQDGLWVPDLESTLTFAMPSPSVEAHATANMILPVGENKEVRRFTLECGRINNRLDDLREWIRSMLSKKRDFQVAMTLRVEVGGN